MWRPGSFNGTTGESWRSTLTQIITNASNANEYQDTIVEGLSDLVVNDNVYLLMEEGFPRITTQNTISYPIEAGMSKIEESTVGSIIGAASTAYNVVGGFLDGLKGTNDFTGVSWQPWERNIPAWQNSRGVRMEYTFKFSLGQFGLWNAYEEVVKPILNLAAPCIPRYQGAVFTQGPWPNAASMLGRVIGTLGNKTASALKNLFSDTPSEGTTGTTSLGDWLSALVAGSFAQFTWTMKFGDWMTFYHMLFENCSISFSNKVDENGWPIQGSIRINMMGVVPMALRANGLSNMAVKFGKEN